MDCSEARSKIIASSIDDDVAAHLRECEACAELAAEDGRLAKALGLAPTVEPDPERYRELIDSMQAEDSSPRGKLRAMPTYQRIVLGSLGVVLSAVVIFIVALRGDWSVYPMMRMALVLGSMAVAGVFAVVLSMPRIYRPERARAWRLGLFVVLLAIPFVPALLPVAHDAHAAGAPPPSFLVGLGKCLGLGTLAAIPALLIIRALQRNAEFSLWGTIFAAVAAAIGANLALQLHCPAVGQAHIALGHGVLGIVYALLAWIVVRTAIKS